jgi:hypothetical protein
MTRTPVAILLFSVAALAVYYPALNRVFADDHLYYMAELHGSTSLADGLAIYDYSISRRYSGEMVGGKQRSEDSLFRPLLFAVLGVENSLFSYHHVWWNVASLALHVLVGVALFRVLLAIGLSLFALPVALLFIVMKPAMELVLWNHLAAYLVAWLLFLVALREFVLLTDSGAAPGRGRESVYLLALSGAVMIYEPMVPITVIGAAIIMGSEWRRGRRPTIRRLLLLTSPVILYVALYLTHLRSLLLIPPYEIDPEVAAKKNHPGILGVMAQAVVATAVWLLHLAAPTAPNYITRAFGRFVITYDFSYLMLPSVVASTGLLLLLRAFRSNGRLTRGWPLTLLLLGALGAYIGIINIGRPYWPNILTISYYVYGFGLLIFILLYSLIDFERVRGAPARLALVFLATLVTAHAFSARFNAIDIGRANEDASRYLTTIGDFIDAHQAETDFSFAIQDHPPELDPLMDLDEGYADDLNRKRNPQKHVSEVLFARYYDAARPKYTLDGRAWRDGWVSR